MRVSICALADAASIRENTLSVLSAGVSLLSRGQFPAPLGADLCVMVEASEDDLKEARMVPVVVRLQSESGEQIGYLEGDFGWKQNDAYVAQWPLNLGLSRIELPRPDRYRFGVKVGDLEEIFVPFVAALSEEDE